MSAGSSNPDASLVEVAEEDVEQALVTFDLPGVDGVFAIQHGADYATVCEALEDVAKEVKHSTQLRGRDHEFPGGER